MITYSEVKILKKNYTLSDTQTSISFHGTSTAEIKYENKKTDPEVMVLGVNENYLSNSGLEIDEGREFNYFDVE